MLKVLSVFGTRPEAIKMAPVVLELTRHPEAISSRVCVTGQHRGMLDQVLELFDIEPDVDLEVMTQRQTLPGLTARIIEGIDAVLAAEKPDVVLVQGDTTTVMAVALVSFYHQITVGHVEAGLRSRDIYSPFPEEINRRIAGVIANLHFAPTATARASLLSEGVPESSIHLTGNTVIDALHLAIDMPMPPLAEQVLTRASLGAERKLVLVTTHRRENLGEPLESICRGIRSLVERNPEVVVVLPVHLNPKVQEPIHRVLGHHDRIQLIEPVQYDVMAHLMNAAYLVLTDSGGLQEEAPAIGKPVLVMRTETERPEAIEAGTAKLIGPDGNAIVQEAEILLHDRAAYEAMARAVNPFGDGKAAIRIVEALRDFSIAPK